MIPLWAKKKRFYIPVILIVLILFGYIRGNGQTNLAENTDKQEEKVFVNVLEIKRKDLNVPLELSGVVEGKNESVLKSEVSGRVVYIEENKSDILSKGYRVAVIESPSIEEEYQSAKLNYNLAEQFLNTVKLSNKNKIDNALAQKKQAEKNLETALSSKAVLEDKKNTSMSYVLSTAELEYTQAYKAVESVLRFWGEDDMDRFVLVSVPTSNKSMLEDLKNEYFDLKNLFLGIPETLSITSSYDLNEVINVSENAKFFSDRLSTYLDYIVTDSVSFTEQDLSVYKSANTAQTAELSLRISKLNNIKSQIRETELNYESLFDDVENRIANAQTALNISLNNLVLAERQAEIEVLSAQSKLDVAKNRLQQASINKSKLIIKMPYRGYITENFVNVGDNVFAGSRVLAVSEADGLKIKSYANVLYKNDIYIGKEVEVKGSDKKYKITQVSTSSGNLDGNFEFEILVDSDEYTQGQVIALSLDVVERDSFSVPLSSVVTDGTDVYVWVVDYDNVVRRRDIVIGNIVSDEVVVKSGLQEGDRVVLDNLSFLSDNMEVGIK